jgi:hypothetical protein
MGFMTTQEPKRDSRRISTDLETAGSYPPGRVVNISRNGLGIRTHLRPSVGEAVRVCFKTPDGVEIEVVGTVRWTSDEPRSYRAKPGCGVELLGPRDAYLEFVDALGA